MIRRKVFCWMIVAILVCGVSVLTACTSNDDNVVTTNDIETMEQSLVGLWWDEYEYADVTVDGKPFSRVLLAVKVDSDHTGCIYLGLFDDDSDEPLAGYGGPEDAPFTWHLLPQRAGNLGRGKPMNKAGNFVFLWGKVVNIWEIFRNFAAEMCVTIKI